jgi:5-methylcytosine-specific restriction endonuclease McrA
MIDEKSYKNLEEPNRKTVLENTFYYLENHLNPDKKWDKEITPKLRIYLIRYANVNWEAVSDHIKGMDYQNFLKTPYWKAIAAHTKYKAGYRCQLCNRAYNLVTHHKDYGIHGFEHARMQDLIVLCYDCHSKFHDRLPEWKPKAISLKKSAPMLKKKATPSYFAIFMILSMFFVCFLVGMSIILNK